MRVFENFSTAAEKNRTPILDQLTDLLCEPASVLEVGSGAGQHAVCFSEAMPHLSWQPADQGEYFAPLVRNIQSFALPNVKPPLYLDLDVSPWPIQSVDHLYSANVLHIISSELVQKFFQGAGEVINELLCVYGPFKYAGNYTTPSNAQFDQWLKSRDPRSGIKDFEWVCELAAQSGLSFVSDTNMPANNQLLVFRKG